VAVAFAIFPLLVSSAARAATAHELLTAASTQDAAAVARAMTAGAPVNAQDGDGWTALTYAAAAGNLTITRTLLQAKADPNLPTKEGQTPLFAAVHAGSVEVVRALLAAGARPEIAAHGGKTPLQLARERNRSDLVALLQAPPAPASQNLKASLSSASRTGAEAPAGQPAARPATRVTDSAPVGGSGAGVPDAVIREFLEAQAAIERADREVQAQQAARAAANDARTRAADDARAQQQRIRYEQCTEQLKLCVSDCDSNSTRQSLQAIGPGGRVETDQALAVVTASMDCKNRCERAHACVAP
jgi:ankyrin repeat protein